MFDLDNESKHKQKLEAIKAILDDMDDLESESMMHRLKPKKAVSITIEKGSSDPEEGESQDHEDSESPSFERKETSGEIEDEADKPSRGDTSLEELRRKLRG